jgi:hypothetical protein
MQQYINGAIKEGIEKGRALMGKIPGARELGPYFSPLATVANNEIESIVSTLDMIYMDPDLGDSKNIKQKFAAFKQLSGRLSEIENVVIAAMNRKSQDDEFVNKLVYEICNEINYPLQSPVASCLSQKYYHIYPYYNLICIPLLESDFVLHIPDVYHELGHPLISLDNPKSGPFRLSLGRFLVEVKKYFDEEIQRQKLNKSAGIDIIDRLYVWKDSWVEDWAVEFFCDLFAVYTLGPAYAWSNIHMCAKMSWDVYRIPTLQKTSHPPDEARMKAIAIALELIGLKTEAGLVATKWTEFKTIINPKTNPQFALAVPEKLLRLAAEYCLIGTKEVKCELYSPAQAKKVSGLLNNSWVKFWEAPDSFADWEKAEVARFKKIL